MSAIQSAMLTYSHPEDRSRIPAIVRLTSTPARSSDVRAPASIGSKSVAWSRGVPARMFTADEAICMRLPRS
jgi:hypothetical protein